MANKDLVSNINPVQAVKPEAITASTTSAAIDMQGYDSACINFDLGAITDGTFTPFVEHSADDVTYTDAGTDGALNGSLSAAHHTSGEQAIQKVGYSGSNRYLKVGYAVSGSTTTGGVVAVTAIQGHPALAPV